MLQKIFTISTYSILILPLLALSTELMTLLVNSSCREKFRKHLSAQYTQIRSHFWEYIMAAIQLSILISSLFTEYGRIFITNGNYAATFLSIYSTIFAVNVALWALFSGVLDNSYMGISYVEYFFSMKPRIYKQKWVVLASLVVLIASCVCYLRGIYGFVGASLLFEIISIGVSTMSLYGIFKSPKLIKDEILQYSLEKQFEQKTEKETEKELLEDNYERISR